MDKSFDFIGVGFNGATGFRRWKPNPLKLYRSPLSDASMGPPAFAGGNCLSSGLSSACLSSFNGATGFRRWKQTPCGYSFSASQPLQWGHRLSPVETRIENLWATQSQRRFNGATGFRRWKLDTQNASRREMMGASMGPPAFAGGNFSQRLQ